MNIKKMFTHKKTKMSDADRENRMRRLRYDFENVGKRFKDHAFIKIQEAAGPDLQHYSIVYKIDGLVQVGASIEAKNEHRVELTLPDLYPAIAPKAAMASALFHPNVSPEKIDIRELWTVGTDLADCIVRIGELITYKRYSLDDPLNGEAAQWAIRNKNLLPLSTVDLKYNEIRSEGPGPMETKIIQVDSSPEANDDLEQTKAIVIENEPGQAIPEAGAAPLKVAAETVDAKSPPPQEQTSNLSKSTNEGPAKTVILDSQVNTVVPPRENKRKQSKEPIKEELGAEKGDLASIMKNKAPAEAGGPAHNKEKGNFGTANASSQQKGFPSSLGSFCSNCGSLIDHYSNFCGRCGTKLKEKPHPGIAKIFFIIGLIAIPILLFEGGFAVYLLNKKVSAPSIPAIPQTPQPPPPGGVTTDQASPVKEDTIRQALIKAPHAPKEQKQEPAEEPDTRKVLSSLSKPVSGVPIGKSRKKKDITEEPTDEAVDSLPTNSVAALAKQADVADNLKLARIYMGIGSYDDALTKFRDVVKVDPFNQEAIQGIVMVKKMKSAAPPAPPSAPPAPAPAVSPGVVPAAAPHTGPSSGK
jgi:ubiquitin-protein ligase